MNQARTMDTLMGESRQIGKGRSWSRWGKSIFAWLLGILLLLAGGGAIYQMAGTAVDLRTHPATGRLIDVGGYKMHIDCSGEGSPTVILDHVGGTNALQWALIQPEIAKHTRVCAYDRAGFGWSEPGLLPRDAAQSVKELHTLLINAEIDGPYLLVGHSYGGNVARVYAAAFPEQVAGLVLVDPGIAFGRPGIPEEIETEWRTQDADFITMAPWLARFGILRLAFALGVMPGHRDLPLPQGEAFDALQLTNQFYSTLVAQAQAMQATSEQILAAEASLRNQPLIVLSAAQPEQDASREQWSAVNAEIAALSTQGIHYVVPGSDHMSLALERDDAAVTTTFILRMLDAVRSGQPLAVGQP